MIPLYQTPLGKEIAQEYQSNPRATISSLAGKYNQPWSAVRKSILVHGKLRNNRESVLPDKAIARYLNGEATLLELSKELQVSHTTIHDWVVMMYGVAYKDFMEQPERRGRKKKRAAS